IIHIGTKKKPKPSDKVWLEITRCGTPSKDYPGMLDVYGVEHGPVGAWEKSSIHVTGTDQWGNPWSHDYNGGAMQIGSDGTIGFQHWAPKEISNLKCSG
ncbi:hypothetical protein DOM01_01040, partial [Salmonella enterica subsp. enterica serovar Derby]